MGLWGPGDKNEIESSTPMFGNRDVQFLEFVDLSISIAESTKFTTKLIFYSNLSSTPTIYEYFMQWDRLFEFILMNLDWIRLRRIVRYEIFLTVYRLSTTNFKSHSEWIIQIFMEKIYFIEWRNWKKELKTFIYSYDLIFTSQNILGT